LGKAFLNSPVVPGGQHTQKLQGRNKKDCAGAKDMP
jgi:hypothetical protein